MRKAKVKKERAWDKWKWSERTRDWDFENKDMKREEKKYKKEIFFWKNNIHLKKNINFKKLYKQIASISRFMQHW